MILKKSVCIVLDTLFSWCMKAIPSLLAVWGAAPTVTSSPESTGCCCSIAGPPAGCGGCGCGDTVGDHRMWGDMRGVST